MKITDFQNYICKTLTVNGAEWLFTDFNAKLDGSSFHCKLTVLRVPTSITVFQSTDDPLPETYEVYDHAATIDDLLADGWQRVPDDSNSDKIVLVKDISE